MQICWRKNSNQEINMNKVSTLFLKLVIGLAAIVVLGICVIGLPAGLMSDQTGLYKPILVGMYFPAIPFFLALYQGLKLLNLIEKNESFSALSVKALKTIKYCAFAISGLYALGMPYIFYAADRDDAPGVVLIGLVIVGTSFVVGVFAAVMQKLIQNAVDIKLENDLTV